MADGRSNRYKGSIKLNVNLPECIYIIINILVNKLNVSVVLKLDS